MSHSAYILRWIRYRHRAITIRKVHSPFLFALINRVIENRKNGEWLEAEAIRNTWAKRKDQILRHDLGAGENKSSSPLSIGYLVKHHAIKKKYGRLLHRMVKDLSPENILELGTSVGISTSYIASASRGSELYSVEACHETQAIARKHPLLQSPGIHFICASFDKALDQLQQEHFQFGLVYIDGDHSKESTLRYFDKLLGMAQPDTVLIFDDIHWSEGMEEAWDLIKARPEVTLTLDLFQFGVVYLKKELSKQDIILRF